MTDDGSLAATSSSAARISGLEDTARSDDGPNGERPARIAQMARRTHTYILCLDMEAHSSKTSTRTFRVTANPRILHIRRPALHSPPTVPPEEIIADNVVAGIDVEHLHGARCMRTLLQMSNAFSNIAY